MKNFLLLNLILTLLFSTFICSAQSVNTKKTKEIAVIGYYAGNSADIDKYPIEKMTHIIFSFLHLKGNQLSVDNKQDSLTIKHLVEFKNKNPKLKIILSLGGWEGCYSCSRVFSTEAGRKEFTQSTKNILEYFKADGLDLDWEYPAIKGAPGHPFSKEDKPNFTALVTSLRDIFGNKYELSFAAGGFKEYIEESIDWQKVIPLVDRINLMSYDLVNGFSTISGHHTPLYSTVEQSESTDKGVKLLIAIGVPADKIVIGAAMYGRIFKLTKLENKGLYQPCTFLKGISYNELDNFLKEHKTFKKYWDPIAKAPYYFSIEGKSLFSYDDPASIKIKTQYAIKNKLNGIMFWQLHDDKDKEGLLDVIDETNKSK